jgi:hypothetical protein
MDVRGLQRLIGLLGGNIGAEYRSLAETTLTRLIAGDKSLGDEVEANAASDEPIQRLAREALSHDPESLESTAGAGKRVRDELENCESLRLAKMTRTQFENALVAAHALADSQRKITEDVCRAEQAKQATHASDLQTATAKAKVELEAATAKAKVELELIEKRALHLAAEREAELAFIERKMRIETSTPPPTPPEGRAPMPKTVRQIACEEDYWAALSTHLREELLCKAGKDTRKEQITPLPDKVKEKNSHGIIFEVYAYDLIEHSAIRGVLRRAYTDQTKKAPKPVPGRPSVRQQGITDLSGFILVPMSSNRMQEQNPG